MVSRPSEQVISESQGRASTVMYLIEIDPNASPCLVDGLPLQILNISQGNAHYLIPIHGTNEVPQCSQPTEDSHLDNNVINNGGSNQDLSSEGQPVIAATGQPKLDQSKPKGPNELTESDAGKPVRRYLHMSDSVPPPLAVSSVPAVLRVRRGSVAPLKLLPPRLRFGPIRGVVREVSSENTRELISKAAASMKPILLLSKDDTVSHIDVSDIDKSNWFHFLPLGDETTANVWIYQEDDGLYGVTTECIAPRVNLCLGYSRQYAEKYSLPANQPVLDIDHEEDHHRKWWCYECRYSCKTASLLQRHMEVRHPDFKSRARKRRYPCKYCSLRFSRLFTLKRHLRLHCKGKLSTPEDPSTRNEPEPTPEVFLNSTPTEEDRLPSDESFHNYTNSLDFSTNLFDTDRMPSLDISASSRTDLNFYGEKDDTCMMPQSGHDGNIINQNKSPELASRTKNSQKDLKVPTFTTCPHCHDIMPSTIKQRHIRNCTARDINCACGKTFRDRERLAQHVYAEHGNKNTAAVQGQADSSDSSYRCEKCQYNFKRRGMLVNHLWRVHGEFARVPLERRERHYPCVACPKLYRSAAKRDRHVRRHHPGAELMRAQCIESGSVACTPAACPACPRQYATRAKMLQHARAAHPHLVSPSNTKQLQSKTD